MITDYVCHNYVMTMYVAYNIYVCHNYLMTYIAYAFCDFTLRRKVYSL